MEIIGLNFTKLSAERISNLEKPNINTSITFIKVEKEKIPDFLKDLETQTIHFKYNLTYENSSQPQSSKKDINKLDGADKKNPDAHITFEGKITLSLDKEESKDLTKSWKKNQIPNTMKVSLFNFILRKCTPKAVHLQDEVNLPSHVPMPRLTPQTQFRRSS